MLETKTLPPADPQNYPELPNPPPTSPRANTPKGPIAGQKFKLGAIPKQPRAECPPEIKRQRTPLHGNSVGHNLVVRRAHHQPSPGVHHAIPLPVQYPGQHGSLIFKHPAIPKPLSKQPQLLLIEVTHLHPKPGKKDPHDTCPLLP